MGSNGYASTDDFVERILYPAFNECVAVTAVNPTFDPTTHDAAVLSVTTADGSEWRITVEKIR